jgi:NAD(P)-dependent dehydrogenase (short-subunit alcohol dehydrogenase family)
MEKILVCGANGTLGQNYTTLYPNDNYILLDKDYKSGFQASQFYNNFKYDFNSKEDSKNLKEYLLENKIKIKGIVFFQGVQFSNSFFSVTEEEWGNTIDTNVKSILFFLKNLYPLLSQSCSIVVLASQNGVVGHVNRIDYGTSKAALIHLVKNLSLEFSSLKEKDIKINCISPGYIYTEKSRSYLESFSGQMLKEKIPYKTFVLPDDVSHTINFLMSDTSKAIRGQNIILDYGYTLS